MESSSSVLSSYEDELPDESSSSVLRTTIDDLVILEEDLTQQLKDLEAIIDDLEKRTIEIAIESSSSSLSAQSQPTYVIFSNGLKIDHKVKRIFQTFRNLRLFRMILNQYHGSFSLAPITLNGYRILLNYQPKQLISSRRVTENVKRLDYSNGDAAYIYNDGSVVIKNKKFIFTRHENKDEEILFPDECKAYFYFSSKTLEYTDKSGAEIRIFASGREEVRFLKGKTYIFDLSGEIVVFDRDGDERLRRKFKI
ncbi:hypothetical protein TRFO_14764 [Tritrichomonas foetus]|uniref:Centromere protein J C-terminal domain-containing protein n=1 Tax=Tritrichomonas foetus TaxID=1144522 RepID=A0A1J4KU70_9EUKA|nr:hypothetical protein TRFO_14764 [Tritrichomonas foetus]|eukprot:OHT14825.1 hypothetical protein TRFO_14764 [Tritrichomonas foetus]